MYLIVIKRSQVALMISVAKATDSLTTGVPPAPLAIAVLAKLPRASRAITMPSLPRR
jgi:hypothetical protein